MAFQNLPVELMQLVLPFCQPAALSSLLLTCRSLQALALRFLYEDIDLGCNNPRIGKPPLQLLLRTLLHRPEFGAITKRLYIRGKQTDSQLNPDDVEALARRGTSISNIKFMDWLAFLSWSTHATGNCQASVVLLLSYCDNLESLALENDLCYTLPVMGTWAVGHVNETTFPIHALSKLQNLRSLEYRRNSAIAQASIWCSSPIVASLFAIPQVKSLIMSVGEDPYGRRPNNRLSKFKAHPSSVTDLELQDSNIGEQSVDDLLSRAPHLTSLRIGLTRDANPRPPDIASNDSSFLDCTILGTCLAGVKSEGQSSTVHPARTTVLRHLAISIKFFSSTATDIANGGAFECGLDANGDWAVNWGIKGSIGSLRDYTVLKTLEIPLPVLLGWYVHRARPLADLLPSSIEELSFRADLSHWDLFKWDVQSVKNLIEIYATSGNRGRLRVLKYTLLAEDIEDNEHLLSEMRRICIEIGVCFEVLRLDSPNEEY